ncbi:hypothetical protein [Heyndrickxia oleronia]|uniref:hypothetical protein n=1 Tax=Heyndrickxia oleronia TaxID=38875 RepID=UPI001C0EC21C|nr:hypothetical protein [Heyndrickxia oleronia]MBU5214398.1 hypothetical protein [Heyndrickxia oleronia]
MKVKDLMMQLKNADPEAHIHIQTKEPFEEDIKDIHHYQDINENEVIVLSSITQWKKF